LLSRGETFSLGKIQKDIYMNLDKSLYEFDIFLSLDKTKEKFQEIRLKFL